MNAPVTFPGLTVRLAELGCARERERVEAFVAAHEASEPFHRPQWSLAVERGCRQHAHYLLAEDRSKQISGVLSLTEMRSSLFGSALVSTGFGVGGGIVANDDTSGKALADAAWDLARTLKCPTVELRGGRLPEGWSRSEGTYAGFSRELASGPEAILLAIPRKQRAEVRRALGFGLEVSVGRDTGGHYRVYSESVRNLGTPVFPRALLKAMLEAFGEDADILTVSKDGRPLSSVLSFYFKGTVYPYWGGGTAEARAQRANELMYYELMRHAARRGCTRFDFGRSKFGTGAFAFKKNWGFEPRSLVYATRTGGGAPPREVNPLSPKYRFQVAAWKKLPLWLANRLGPPIARGLG